MSFVFLPPIRDLSIKYLISEPLNAAYMGLRLMSDYCQRHVQSSFVWLCVSPLIDDWISNLSHLLCQSELCLVETRLIIMPTWGGFSTLMKTMAANNNTDIQWHQIDAERRCRCLLRGFDSDLNRSPHRKKRTFRI